MNITYDLIKPLIKKEALFDGNQIHLEFCAKNQEKALATIAVIIPDQNKIKKNVSKQVLVESLKNTIINKILNMLGLGSLARNFIRSSVNDVISEKTNSAEIMKTKITKENKEKTIVDAFMNVKAMYNYNEQTEEWEYTTQNS